MPAVPFPKSSTPGSLPGEGEGRLINACVVQEGDTFYTRRVPGLSDIGIDTGKTGPRGALVVNDVEYRVYSDGVVTIAPDGTVTTLSGSIPGSDGVTIARNNRTTEDASTPDVVAVRSTGGAYVLTATEVLPYPDADLPSNVNSVDFIGGFFDFSCLDGRSVASELNSTDINALSFATAEARADRLLRTIVHSDRSYKMGESTIEPWQNMGDSPYPLRRAASIIQVGLKTTMAVAGNEEGWNGPLVFVASDNTVRLLQGFDTRPVSTRPVQRFIQNSDPASLEVYVCVWADGSQIAGVTSNIGTWEYNLSSGNWHERLSTGTNRWRGSRTIKRGNDWVVADRLSGKLLKIDAGAYTEAGAALPWTVESAPLKQFPSRVQVPAFMADFAPADGDVSISWSHDGTKTWTTPLTRSLAQADRFPVRVNRLGLSTQHGPRFRLSVSDPVAVSLMGATVENPQARAA